MLTVASFDLEACFIILALHLFVVELITGNIVYSIVHYSQMHLCGVCAPRNHVVSQLCPEQTEWGPSINHLRWSVGRSPLRVTELFMIMIFSVIYSSVRSFFL